MNKLIKVDGYYVNIDKIIYIDSVKKMVMLTDNNSISYTSISLDKLGVKADECPEPKGLGI